MANQQAAYANTTANLNHPMDDTVTSGYWARQKSQDEASARRSDVMLDNYRSTDTTTGTVYTHGAAAYDSAGGVVNPERPNEYLTPEAQWQGRKRFEMSRYIWGAWDLGVTSGVPARAEVTKFTP